MGVRTFALGNQSERIAIVTMSGHITIYDLVVERGSIGKTYVGSNLLCTKNDLISKKLCRGDASTGCAISWNNHGNQLAIPSSNGTVYVLYNKNSNGSSMEWEEAPLVSSSEEQTSVANLSHNGLDVAMTVFSPNGKYIASVDIEGNILIWDIDDDNVSHSNVIRKVKNADKIPLLDMQWGQITGDNYIIATTTNKYSIFNGIIRIEIGYLNPTVMITTTVKDTTKNASSTSADMTSSNDISTTTGASVKSNAIQQKSYNRIRKSNGGTADDEDDNINFNDDDDAQIKQFNQSIQDMEKLSSSKDENQSLRKSDNNRNKNTDKDNDVMLVDDDNELHNVDSYEAENLAESFVQLPISLSSTTSDESNRRYLVWNGVGHITLTDDGVLARIDIKFSDLSGSNKNESWSDSNGFTRAALAYEGAAFSSPAEVTDNKDDPDDAMFSMNSKNTKGSVVHYKSFPQQSHLRGANESFTTTLPSGEDVTNICVGSGFIAVSTSKGFLRIFSSTGLQLSVTWLKGPVVCLVAANNSLSVVYNAATSMSVTAVLRADMYNITHNSMISIADVAVPVSPGCTLAWATYSSDGLLCTLDTNGILSMLLNIAGWQWVPVLDTTELQKTIYHVIWPVTVKSQGLCYVLLNGETKPRISPEPVVSTRPFKLPIVEVRDGKDKGAAVNERIRSYMWDSMICNHVESIRNDYYTKAIPFPDNLEPDDFDVYVKEKHVAADKKLLKMFHVACDSNRVGMAIDLMGRIKTEEGLQLGIIIANQTGRSALANNLESMLEERRRMIAMGMNSSQQNYSPDRNTQSQNNQHNNYDSHSGAMSPTPNNEDIRHDGRSSTTGRNMFESITQSSLYPTQDSAVAPITKRPVAPVNKFAQSSVPSPQKKRKDVYETVRDLKGSPSPKKVSVSTNIIYYIIMYRSIVTSKLLFLM
jgi:chromosome transmission fidelity protein 4